MKLWEVSTGRCLRTLRGHNASVRSIFLASDARYALSGSDDRTLKLWEVASGRCLRTFEGHGSVVASVFLSADNRHALSGSFDRTLKLWEVSSGRCLRTFAGHTYIVASVFLSADGSYALSGSFDKTLRLWEVSSGRCLRTFEGHGNAVTSVFLSADGRFGLSGSGDGTLKLWELDWQLQDRSPADWDEAARPHVEVFLSRQTPYAMTLPPDRQPTEGEITLALSRHGSPRWEEADLKRLRDTLGWAGLGWLRPDGVRKKLQEMAANWRGPPPPAKRGEKLWWLLSRLFR